MAGIGAAVGDGGEHGARCIQDQNIDVVGDSPIVGTAVPQHRNALGLEVFEGADRPIGSTGEDGGGGKVVGRGLGHFVRFCRHGHLGSRDVNLACEQGLSGRKGWFVELEFGREADFLGNGLKELDGEAIGLVLTIGKRQWAPIAADADHVRAWEGGQQLDHGSLVWLLGLGIGGLASGRGAGGLGMRDSDRAKPKQQRHQDGDTARQKHTCRAGTTAECLGFGWVQKAAHD